MEMYSDDIVCLLFDHSSPQWRMGSARIFKNWLLDAWKCTQMTLFVYFVIIADPGGGLVVPEFSTIGF